MSDKICRECISSLMTSYSLKLKFIETTDSLKQVLQSFAANPLEINLISTETQDDYPVEDTLEENSPIEPETPTLKRQTSSKKSRTKPVPKSKNKKPEEDDYRCFICHTVFDLISSKDAHVKKDHKNVKVCSICNKRKQTAMSLENHLRFHKFGYRFLCSCCGRSFRFRNLLENHLKVEHLNSVKFNCDICSYETKFKINVERHIKSVHMKLKNFKCDHCDDHEYSTQVGLNLHLYRCHGVPAPVNCPDCLQGFTFESELRVHKKHCTGNTIRIAKSRPQDAPVDILDNGFRCRICLNIYETRSKWSVHFHHKHKNTNICGICNKQMASSTSLFKHVQVQHNQIKKFQCEICNKTFGFKHSLESHRNTHTGEKPFSCNLCSFRSGDRSTISKHKKKMHAESLQ
jgi:hypothetical protein